MKSLRKFFYWAALGCCAWEAAAQTPVQGDLLVASPTIADTRFVQSVLLVLRHGESGSIGVLVNRPTSLQPAAVFEDLDALSAYRGRLYYGGPVLPTRLLLLMRDPPPAIVDGPAVIANIYLSGDPSLLAGSSAWADDDSRLRLYAGHAAWEPEQLEAEIAAGNWTLVTGRPDLVFTDAPLELWQRAMAADGEVVVDASARHLYP